MCLKYILQQMLIKWTLNDARDTNRYDYIFQITIEYHTLYSNEMFSQCFRRKEKGVTNFFVTP